MSARRPGHRRSRAGAVSLSLVVSTLCCGCAARHRAIRHPVPAALPSVAALEAVLASRRETLNSLRALARLRYTDRHESVASREAIVVARPDRLRVEVLSLFGSIFVLVADHGLMTAYARKENTVYRGMASPENLEEYVHLGLSVDALVDVVLGTPPPSQAANARVSFDGDVGAVRLDRQSQDRAQIVWFSAIPLPIATEERRDGGAEWRATFAEYKEQGGLPIATRIGLDMPAASRSVQITLHEIDVNPSLDDSVFTLPVPPGSEVVDLRSN